MDRFIRPSLTNLIEMSVESPPLTLIMLLDPRGKVHATSGILPVKAIDIPPEQYSNLLQHLEVTFLVAPILTDQSAVNLPTPAEPGYVWSWLENKAGAWQEEDISQPNPSEPFSKPQKIREGWLKFKPDKNLPNG